MEGKSETLKIYFLPFMAMGHMIPLVHIARMVAAHGEHVTIITTPMNAKVLTKLIEHDRVMLGRNIHIHTIVFPSKEVGLPEGLENLSFATDIQSFEKIFEAADLLCPQVEAFVKINPPHIVVTDNMLSWSGQLTTRMGIPRLVFNPLSIFVACVTHEIKKQYSYLDGGDLDTLVLSDLPHPITLTVKPSLEFIRFLQSCFDTEENSLGVIVNSFQELEPEYAQHYEKITGRKVWHVGPSLHMLNTHTDEARNKVVGRDRIEEAVRRLMDGGDEAFRVRKCAKELQRKLGMLFNKVGPHIPISQH